MGGAVGQTLKMGLVAPQMLAVGAALGFITAKAGELYDRILEVNKELPNIKKVSAEIENALSKQVNAGVISSDPAAATRRAFDRFANPVNPADAAAIYGAEGLGVDADTARKNLDAFRKTAPGARLSPSQAVQVAAGYGDKSSEVFSAFTGTVDQEANRGALRVKGAAEYEKNERERNVLRENAGLSNDIALELNALTRMLRVNLTEQQKERDATKAFNMLGMTTNRQDKLVSDEAQIRALLEERGYYRSQASEATK